jgi:circadian clock protein KaiC
MMKKPSASDRQVTKTPTGIPGLDEILRGGLPRERISLVLGGPGSGKTILALQTLVNGARLFGEPGIFVAFEENKKQIIGNASTFGWDLSGLQKKKLFFLDARMGPELVKAGEFDLSAMLAIVTEKAREMNAKRVVFDAIDVLLALLDDPAAERQELFRLYHWLQQSGLTAVITAKAEHAAPFGGPQFTNMQFMSDAVITLSHELSNQVSLRKLWVMKFRGSGFAENEVSLTIGDLGIEVSPSSRLKQLAPVTKLRVSSGVQRLDAMLGGGYYRGSSVLVTGSPGTAKSSLGAAFAQAACARRERVLYLSFDESPAELTRNFSSIGIDFRPHLESGLLQVQSLFAEGHNAKEHFNQIRQLIEQHRPACLVVDPISALNKSGGEPIALSIAERLVNLCKVSGITVVNISLLLAGDPQLEASAIQISTIADAWIQLSYVVRAGERNRAITIIKSRGTNHSNQVREMILSGAGITLADAYTADGEVLMGTMRWQKEQTELLQDRQHEAEVERKKLELSIANDELGSRLQFLKREILLKEKEMDLLITGEKNRKDLAAARAAALRQKRRADTGAGGGRR